MTEPSSLLTASDLSVDVSGLDGVMSGEPSRAYHLYPLVVQYEDTDAGGIAYHSCYINYAERARSALMRCCGYSLADSLETLQQGFVVSAVEADYLRPARLHDRILVRTSLRKLGGASLTLQQDIYAHQDGHILARVSVHLVWMKLNAGPVRFPDDLKQIMSTFI